jgi:c-di-GMP-binding flagellar brake protein YcgR
MFWRRRFPRLRADFQITYRMVDQEKLDHDPIKSLALNISGGGLCFEAIDNLQKGALVALDIRSEDFRRFLKKNILCHDVETGRIRISHCGNSGWRCSRSSTARMACLLSVTPFWYTFRLNSTIG